MTGYFVYQIHRKAGVAHAGSWTQLSLQTVGSTTPQDLGGISAVACQTQVDSIYQVQLEVTDTNTTYNSIYYKTLESSTSTKDGYKLSSSKNETTATDGQNQDVTLNVPVDGAVAMQVAEASATTKAAYFYNSTQSSSLLSGNQSATQGSSTGSSTASSSSSDTKSIFISPVGLSACPGDSATTGSSTATTTTTPSTSPSSPSQSTPQQSSTQDSQTSGFSDDSLSDLPGGSFTGSSDFSATGSDITGFSTTGLPSGSAISDPNANTSASKDNKAAANSKSAAKSTKTNTQSNKGIWHKIAVFFKSLV